MSIPVRTSDLEFSTKWHKHIIIHHTNELELNASSIQFDTPAFQTSKFKKIEFQKSQTSTPPYHFIVDQVEDDYEIVVGRPLLTNMSEFEDLDVEYQNGLHIGVLGNYNEDIPPARLYSVMALKIICPFMKMFNIPTENVVFHSDVSKSKKINCPGDLFVYDKLVQAIKTQTKRVSVSRN